jgi:hypothetical protein
LKKAYHPIFNRYLFKLTLKKPCRGFYVSQNILPTSFEIDQIQNIIDIGNCAVWCFYAEKCSERSRVRISGWPKNYFSDKTHQRRKINDQSRGIKAKRHTPMEYDD